MPKIEILFRYSLQIESWNKVKKIGNTRYLPFKFFISICVYIRGWTSLLKYIPNMWLLMSSAGTEMLNRDKFLCFLPYKLYWNRRKEIFELSFSPGKDYVPINCCVSTKEIVIQISFLICRLFWVNLHSCIYACQIYWSSQER